MSIAVQADVARLQEAVRQLADRVQELIEQNAALEARILALESPMVREVRRGR